MTGMNSGNFFGELKRRNVYKVAVAYIVGGWALSQGIAQVLPVFDVSNWAIRLIVLLIIIGFPVALILSWFFEITPEGIKPTAVADTMARTKEHKTRTWIYVVIIGAAVSIGLFFLGRFKLFYSLFLVFLAGIGGIHKTQIFRLGNLPVIFDLLLFGFPSGSCRSLSF
jgi:hypothetical protein